MVASKSWACLPLVLVLLVTTEAVQAFDADLHPAYTRQAAQAWRGCSGVELSNSDVTALASGTEAEDISIATAWQRITNWHFYNRDGKLQSAWFAHRNIERIYAIRVEKLNTLLKQPIKDRAEIFEQAGRVMHYIQDMSVPAHVVPIFHVAGMGDALDSFQRTERAPAFSLSPDQCEQIRREVAATSDGLHTLLKDAAESTLASISQDAAWQNYWFWPARDADEAAKGWGEYGHCRFVRGPAEPGCKSEAQIEAFFEQRYQRTLMDSVRVMAWLAKRM